MFDGRGIADGRGAVHQQPSSVFFLAQGPEVMNGLLDDNCMCGGGPLRQFSREDGIAFFDPLET